MKELKGLPAAKKITENLKSRIDELQNKDIIPKLSVVRIGNNSDDISYEKGIIKKFTSLNALVDVIELPSDVNQDKLESVVTLLNTDKSVHGILIFRPLPKHLSEERIKYIIDDKKDVDCIGQINIARVFSGSDNSYPPCTAQAVMEIIDYYGIDLTGKKVVVVGRSMVVGKPLSMLLLGKNATVTICHTKTKNLSDECKKADILIACAGKAKMITPQFTNPSQTVIDVGINFENNILCGDVDFEEVIKNVDAITPVPGGVGTVTTTVLLKHTVTAAENQQYNKR